MTERKRIYLDDAIDAFEEWITSGEANMRADANALMYMRLRALPSVWPEIIRSKDMEDLINETDKVIAELQWFRSVLRKGGKVAEYYEAQSDILTKAIKLLEQPEQKTDEDPISRQAAIDVADYTDYTGLAVEDVKKVTDEVVKGLKQLPSAQPEPLTCDGCKYEKNGQDLCYECCRGCGDMYEERKDNG